MQASDMQPEGDPVRAAAESVEAVIAEHLLRAWQGVAVLLPHVDSPHSFMGVGFEDGITCAAQFVVRAYRRGENVLWDTLGPRDLVPIRKDDVSQIDFRYDRVAPTTLTAAQNLAAQWVREISDETRTQISQTIQQGMTKGLPAPKIAQTVRESIGLTAAQAKTVANYRRMLETNSLGALNYRLRDPDFDDEVQQAVVQLRQLKPAQIDAQVQSYYQRYLTFRAQTIARFEALFASNSGAASAITQAVAQGALPTNTLKRWLVAHDERLCPRCRSIPEIQPAGVRLDQPFEWRVSKTSSGSVMIPPLHPRCRCTITYRVMK